MKSERPARIEWAYRGITRLGCGRPEQLTQADPVDLSRAGSEIEEVLREFAWTAPTVRMNQALWEFLMGPRKAGENGKGLVVMAEDFEAPLDDFGEYML